MGNRSEKLTIALAQMAVVNSRPEENLKKAEKLVANAKQKGAELICFPEMWTTGFNWENNERLLKDAERTVKYVADLARQNNIWLNGSLLTRHPSGKPMNTSLLFNDRGEEAARYGKTHLFTYMHEEQHMVPGDKLCTVETPWGLFGLAICYDIRFPELFRTYALQGVKVVLIPMAFPYPRVQHFKTLIRARAIEDQLFMVGTNQVGDETISKNDEVAYFGFSSVIDPWGETVVEGSEAKEELLVTSIDLGRVEEIREKMKVLQDRRPELYELGPRP
jgi:omega-amidase